MQAVAASAGAIKAGMWRITVLIGCLAVCIALNSCNTKQDPEALRRKTAEATANLKSDAKAAGQGINEGLRSKPKVDLNTATEGEIAKLPGMTPAMAARVVHNRPYDNPDQLVTRRVIPQEEYDKISGQVAVKK